MADKQPEVRVSAVIPADYEDVPTDVRGLKFGAICKARSLLPRVRC